MELDPNAFNRFLGRIGVPVLWKKSMVCPCQEARTGGTNVTCSVCGGLRYLWDQAIETTVGVQSLQRTQQFSQFGEWDKGDMLATIPSDSPAYMAGEYDQFTIVEAEFRWTALLTKGTQDTLKHRHVKRIERVLAIENSIATDYTEMDDYLLNGASISWLPSATLADGSQYTVRYWASPDYYVYTGLVQDRPQFSRDLPRKVTLRGMDLWEQSLAS